MLKLRTYTSILSLLLSIFISPVCFAEKGSLFKVVANGNKLTITPTTNHFYHSMGIKVTSGQTVKGCSKISNGFCIFAASKSNPGHLTLNSTANHVKGILCLDGQAQYSCQTINLKISLCSSGGTCRVFLSSSTQTGNMGGLSGGNSICQSRANNAGLGGNWRAWLSSDTVDAKDNIQYLDTITYVLALSRSLVALPGALLTTNVTPLSHAINETENGTPPFITVWTGTIANGTAGVSTCNNWLSDAPAMGIAGSSSNTNSGWTAAGADPSCSNARPIYCFEVP